MKDLLKSIVAGAVVLAVLALAPPSQAQKLGSPQSVLNSNLALSASTAVTQTVSAVASANLNLSATLTGAGAGVTNPGTLTFQKSIDQSNWTTGFSWTITPTGVTPVTIITNIATGGVGYWRLITADNTANSTNLLVVVTAAKDNTGTGSIGTTLKVGGTSYTPGVGSIITTNLTQTLTVTNITTATFTGSVVVASSSVAVVTNAVGTSTTQALTLH